MVYKDGHFLLQDQTTQEVIEITGPNLAANVGNRVEARGAASSAPATRSGHQRDERRFDRAAWRKADA